MGFKLGKNKVKKKVDYAYNPKNADELASILHKKYMKCLDIFGNANDDIILDLNDIDVSNINDLSWMFGSESKRIKVIDISEWDTSNVTDVEGMFSDCEYLEEIIGLEDINLSGIKSLSNMFNGCYSLKSIDISNFNTKNILSMYGMFASCHKLTEIKGIDNIIVDNVRDMNYMFTSCYSLKSIDVSKWNLHANCKCRSMFAHCVNLEEIKGVEIFDNIKDKENKKYIFMECDKLKNK